MRNYKFSIRGNTYEVEIQNIENNIAEIEVNGTQYKVEIHREEQKNKTPKLVRARVPEPKTSEKKIKKNISAKGFAIKAPLPGTILNILVSTGQEVKRGDVLLVMEAMKMENNVLAEKDGTIGKIHIATGAAVLQNDVLLEMA